MAEWRVLVVDDDTHMLDLMTRRLSRMGLQADKAQEGKTAVGLVEKTAYDLILTDIYMPGGTGLDILRKAKENDPHVQVIVVTGSATLDNAVEALNMGAFSYLAKPFDHMSVFDNAVARALEFRRLIRDNQRLGEIQRRRGDMLEAEVTDRIRQMRRKQQDMIDLLARLPEGVLVVDAEGRILLSNAPAEAWLAREARFEVQPLRRYLSTLTPPRRSTRSETEIDGVFLQLTAQPLPSEEGKPRTLVTIGEAKAEGGDVRGRLAGSVRALRPGLDWLAKQALDEKGMEVVRRLATQVAAIEAVLKADAAEVVEVDWAELALGEDHKAEAGATRGRAAMPEARSSPGDEWTPSKPQWPPPRAGLEGAGEEALRPAPARRERPKRGADEEKFGTVILNEEGAEAEAPIRPAAAKLGSDVEEATPEGLDLRAGLSRLLEHLAETSPGAGVEEVVSPISEVEHEAPHEAAPQPPEPEPAAAPPAEPAPVQRTSGLLGKMRREAKQPPAPGAPEEGRPRPKKGTGRIIAPPPEAAAEPIPEAAPAPRLGSGPLSRKRSSGLLGKVRRSQGAPLAAAVGPAVEPLPETHEPVEVHPEARPPTAGGETDERDLSKLLEAVREAAGVTETGEPIKTEAVPAPQAEAEEPPQPPLTPPPGRRGPIWPPPLPSETDEE